jgi:two-component system cell cycle sensor histidine kinase/response regulator CckA
MLTPLRVLIVEDAPDDADLMLRELRRGGYEPSYRRLADVGEFIGALDSQEWDLILCDYTMPGFSGTQALALVRSRGLDVPFIFVSGTIGEETAVAAMRAGAQDYVVKGNLKRLVPAIERELREAEMRRDRARADAERRTAESRFREILAMAPDAIVAADADQRITIFNRAAETLFGYSAEEVSGQFLDLLLPSSYAAGHRRYLEDFAQASVAVRRMDERGEVLGRRKDGEEFPAEASISKIVENGKTTFMTVIRDITERKRADATLRKLSRAVEQSANLVIITDVEGTIEYVNSQLLQAMGYKADEVIGRKPALWKSERSSDREYAELWRTILAGHDWNGEFENRRKDGSLISVSATISPIRDQSGRITHFIGIQEDITQRKLLEEQLRQSQKLEAVGQFTGGLAHDFNNLLTVIIGNLDLLQGELQQNPNAHKMAQLALGASLRGSGLVRQLLAFSRRQALEPKVFDINELIAGATDILGWTLGEQIKVEENLAADLWLAAADQMQVESALVNLAINARDAMPDGGRFTIATANKHLDARYAADNLEVTPGEYVMLAVSDTGIGIPPETLHRVFEPFFTTKEAGKGTGLGLSMIFGFAKQSRGHVKIYSEVGHGTTVRLYLPKAEADTTTLVDVPPTELQRLDKGKILLIEDNADVHQDSAQQLEALGHHVVQAGDAAEAEIPAPGEPVDLQLTGIVGLGGMTGQAMAATILVVDDLNQNRDIARMMLEAAGFVVDVASDGAEAVAAVQAKLYDLVLMDSQMDGMDGIEAAEAIRSLDHPAKDIPIISMTANITAQDLHLFKAAGIDDYLAKPFRRKQIIEKVRHWLNFESAGAREPPKAHDMTSEARAKPCGDRDGTEGLLSMMGRDWVVRGFSELNDQLERAFGKIDAGAVDRDLLARQAHALVSRAAILGFSDLAQLCSLIEQACRSGGALEPALSKAKAAAIQAQAAASDLPQRLKVRNENDGLT